MSRKTDIEALLNRADKTLPKINEEYEKALHAQSISADLRIDIKDYFGNLRSVLDYLAHDIVEMYCPNANPRDILYFPIRADQASFDNVMKKSYPDLQTNYRDIYDVLEELQPFKKPENVWLTHFNKLNNENKHERLVAQKRTETKRVNVQIKDGGGVSWDPSAVKFGSGVFIGGVPVNPHTQMPNPSNTQTVTIETWVDFQFDDINVSAIWLTRESLKQIQTIYSHLKDKI
ncbi:hypothetical protein [Algoriphagus aquimarinus]|uniref:hypothetical protein n=1 Tax=Algoriphagus aquimarinus TaxID=237018 RepID=UPI0030D6FB33|tara:strand:- start:5310 stop:6005 length:696 start_codon:yes stop_codon:yes gene_type:complete